MCAGLGSLCRLIFGNGRQLQTQQNPLSQWQNFDLKGYLESQFQLPVYISNDNDTQPAVQD